MNSTNELDNFIRKIQVRSRVIVGDKIISIKPVQEKVKFNMIPSDDNYNSCCVMIYARQSEHIYRATV